MKTQTVAKEIRILRNVFEQNENAARQNRDRFERCGITCINILGGAGCGKTSLLEGLLPCLRDSLGISVLEGDVATTRDAERIARLGVPVVQLLTDGGCHLSATLVHHALDEVSLDQTDLLIVENVGNPICPANFDLGEHLRISVLSVTEGDDKPSKYPLLFKGAAAVVLTKCDLLPHTDFDIAQARHDIRRVNADGEIFQVSARNGEGVARLGQWILARCRHAASSPGIPQD